MGWPLYNIVACCICMCLYVCRIKHHEGFTSKVSHHALQLEQMLLHTAATWALLCSASTNLCRPAMATARGGRLPA